MGKNGEVNKHRVSRNLGDEDVIKNTIARRIGSCVERVEVEL